MDYAETMERIAQGFEVAGVAVIASGGLVALLGGFRDFKNLDKFFVDVRRSFGRPLILGLEILVAADIIETITVDSSLESVAVLGILVFVRTLLSFSLDIEVEGVAPWRRAEMEERQAAEHPDTGQ